MINCEINLQLKWSEKCILNRGTAANQIPKFTKTESKFYVPFVTLSTQDNAKLLQKLESGIKRTINWNKYQSKEINQVKNRYSHFLVDPCFRGVNKLFVSSFENEIDRES